MLMDHNEIQTKFPESAYRHKPQARQGECVGIDKSAPAGSYGQSGASPTELFNELDAAASPYAGRTDRCVESEVSASAEMLEIVPDLVVPVAFSSHWSAYTRTLVRNDHCATCTPDGLELATLRHDGGAAVGTCHHAVRARLI